MILKADVSCGCVAAEFPKKPIMPGESSVINVEVDTKEQEGAFNKIVFIKSNAQNDVELIRIIGNVKR